MNIREGQKKMVFISYSSKDKVQADCVRSVLDENGIKCWMAPESIECGSVYMQVIPEALEACDVLLVLVSYNSQKSVWVSKEIESAIGSLKMVLPLRIDNEPLSKEFDFYFKNLQMINCCENLEKDCEKLIPIIRKAERITNDVVFETSFSNKTHKEENGKLLIRSPKSKSENETAIYIFTKNTWNEFSYYVQEITAILNQSKTEMIAVDKKEELGEYECAPVDNQSYWKGPGRLSFKVRDINHTQKNNIKTFYFELNRENVKLEIYYDGEIPEGDELSYFGIDEEALLSIVKNFIIFMRNSSDIKIGKKLSCERRAGCVKFELLFG